MPEKSRAASSLPSAEFHPLWAQIAAHAEHFFLAFRISFWHSGIDSYRAPRLSIRVYCGTKRIAFVSRSGILSPTVEFVFAWAWLTSGLHNRAKCRNVSPLKRRRIPPPPSYPREWRDLTGRIGSVQLLAQEVLRSDSSLLRGILGYISAARSPGLKANGVDRGLYPPST